MNVSQIDNIIRKDLPIQYRRYYTAEVVLEYPASRTGRTGIEFSIEHSPLGHTEIQLRFLEHPDYPLVPALRATKQRIAEMDKQGQLP